MDLFDRLKLHGQQKYQNKDGGQEVKCRLPVHCWYRGDDYDLVNRVGDESRNSRSYSIKAVIHIFVVPEFLQKLGNDHDDDKGGEHQRKSADYRP